MTDLGAFTDKQLRQELAKRKNKDFYYIMDSPNDDSDEHRFAIVHKRYWHHHHRVVDDYIKKKIALPRGFTEESGPVFEYNGTLQDGEEKLMEYGFTKHENPLWGGDAMNVWVPVLGIGWPRLSWISDTVEIKSQLTSSLPDLSSKFVPDPAHKFTIISPSEYKGIMREFANQHELHFTITSKYSLEEGQWLGCEGSLMSKAVYESLPRKDKIAK